MIFLDSGMNLIESSTFVIILFYQNARSIDHHTWIHHLVTFLIPGLAQWCLFFLNNVDIRVSLESGILTPGRCAGFDAHILCKALAGICDRGIVVYCLVCVRLCLRVCRNQRRLSGALRRPNTDTRYSVILLIGNIAQKKKYLRHRLWHRQK